MAKMMGSKAAPKDSPGDSKKKKRATEARAVKKAKDKAEIEMQKLLGKEGDNVEDMKFKDDVSKPGGSKLRSKSDTSDEYENSGDSSSEKMSTSSSSTVHSVSNNAKKIKDNKDYQSLKALQKTAVKVKRSKEEDLPQVAADIKQALDSKGKSDVLDCAAKNEFEMQTDMSSGIFGHSSTSRLMLKLKKEEEMQEKEAELKRMEAEIRRREEEMKKKEEELRKKEEIFKCDKEAEFKQAKKKKKISKKSKRTKRQNIDTASESDSGENSSLNSSPNQNEIPLEKQKLESELQDKGKSSKNNEVVQAKLDRDQSDHSHSVKMNMSNIEEEDCTASDQDNKKLLKPKTTNKSSSSDSEPDSSSDDSSSGSQSDSSDSSEPKPKKKKSKKRVNVERNMEIYPGVNYVNGETDPGVVKLHDDFDVYIKRADLDCALKAKNQSLYVRYILDKVYTLDALLNTTPLGYPPRSKGYKFYKKGKIPPRLHPDGLGAIIRRCLDEENSNKKWRPRMVESVIMSRISNKCCELSRKYRKKNKSNKKSKKKNKD